MIRCYAACMPGPYHIDNAIPCQDAFHILCVNENTVIASACDGLGSMSKSDVGSYIVSRKVVEYCASHYKNELAFNDVKKIMNNAFVYAYKSVLETATAENESSDEYDTTVCLAIYDKGHVFYGQSGDSGMVALMRDGHYVPITEQQRDEDGYVFPLCSGPEKWVFGEIEGDVASIMIMTDGVWEQICPKVLKDNDVKVNVPLTQKFMDRTENTEEDISSLQKSVYNYLDKYPRRLLDDDKTVVVIYDPDRPADVLDEEYYNAPDWKALRDKAEGNLYAKRDDTKKEPEVTSKPINSDSSVGYSSVEKNGSFKQDEIDLIFDHKHHSTKIIDDVPKKQSKNVVNKEDRPGEKREDSEEDSRPPPKGGGEKQKENNHRNKKADEKNKKRPISLKKTSDLITIAILLGFSLFACLMNGFVKEHASVSCIGVLLVCFVANSTVLLPAPSILVVLEYSLIINPIAVAVCGAIGASLGEMVGFLTGLKGRTLINSKTIQKLEEKFPKHPYIFIFAFSALPLPLFDVIGVLSGAARVNIIKFYLICVSGKLVKMLMFVAIGKMVMQMIS